MIKAIETRYKGYRFRSRLEARWAVFFDALDVPWEYEPEGFDLGAAGRYLPDFWLNPWGAWFEVKPCPIEPRGNAWAKAQALAERDPVIVAGGSIGDHALTFFCHDMTDSSAGGPNDYAASIAWSDKAGPLLLVEAGRRYRALCNPELEVLDWAINPYGIGPVPQHLKVTRAISAARAARFEYGETPR